MGWVGSARLGRYASHPSVTPAYPFGHGLSYTTFGYSNLAVDATRRTVTCQVANSGAMAGSEVPQLYLGFPSNAGEPPKQLKGYTKVTLAAGASTTVAFELDDRSFSIWNIPAGAAGGKHGWEVVAGSFAVMVGPSSGDIRLTGSILVAK